MTLDLIQAWLYAAYVPKPDAQINPRQQCSTPVLPWGSQGLVATFLHATWCPANASDQKRESSVGLADNFCLRLLNLNVVWQSRLRQNYAFELPLCKTLAIED
jgi:hypothetical protein